MSTLDNSGIRVRLQFLINENKITIYRLAKDIRTDAFVLYSFLDENNTRSLSLSTLSKLSKYFNVSLFWLINGYSIGRKNNNEDV